MSAFFTKQKMKRSRISPFVDALTGFKNKEKTEMPVFDGFSLDKDLKGEIIDVTLAPNESKVIPHGLRAIPLYRLILRQTGNGVVTDVNDYWTERTLGLKNNSGTDTVVLKIKIFPG